MVCILILDYQLAHFFHSAYRIVNNETVHHYMWYFNNKNNSEATRPDFSCGYRKQNIFSPNHLIRSKSKQTNKYP